MATYRTPRTLLPRPTVSLPLRDMSVSEIQQAVESLSEEERLRLTARMVLRYPLMNVAPLMGYTAGLVARNDWTLPPKRTTADSPAHNG
jgi:hypothetical protein